MTPGAWTLLPPIAALETDTDILARSGQIGTMDNSKRAHGCSLASATTCAPAWWG
jgi:hypothetical protein